MADQRPTLNPTKWIKDPIDGTWSRPFFFGRDENDPARFRSTLYDEWKSKTEMEQIDGMNTAYDNWYAITHPPPAEPDPAQDLRDAEQAARDAALAAIDAQRAALEAQQRVVDLQDQIAQAEVATVDEV